MYIIACQKQLMNSYIYQYYICYKKILKLRYMYHLILEFFVYGIKYEGHAIVSLRGPSEWDTFAQDFPGISLFYYDF